MSDSKGDLAQGVSNLLVDDVKPTKPHKQRKGRKAGAMPAHLKPYSFKAGQNMNPAGRPTDAERATKEKQKLLDSYRHAAFAVALDTLIHVCRNRDSDPARVAAAKELNQRGLGNPESSITVAGRVDHVHQQLGYEELLVQMHADLLEREHKVNMIEHNGVVEHTVTEAKVEEIPKK